MSGPSSSDLTARRKFQITERNNPVPCCGPSPVTLFENRTAELELNVEYQGAFSVPLPALTVQSIAPITVVAIANVTGSSGQTITMKVEYNSNLDPTLIEIILEVITLSANGSVTLYGTATFIPTAADTYNFQVSLKTSSGAPICNNVTLFAIGN